MKKITLVGNPNVGKTAILNALCHSNYHVANWAGVTVTKQEGSFTKGKETYYVLDLPGVFGLNPQSIDEKVAVNELITQDTDLILNVIDSTNLERNLMLTLELLALKKPMLILLHFHDEFKKLQFSIDKDYLEKILGVKCIYTSAKNKEGLKEVKDYITKEDYPISYFNILRTCEIEMLKNKEDIVKEEEKIIELLPNISKFRENLKDFLCIEVMARNRFILRLLGFSRKDKDKLKDIINLANLRSIYFAKAKHILELSSFTKKYESRLTLTKKIDNVLLHPIWGNISFLVIITALFSIVFNMANPLIDLVDFFINSWILKYVEILVQGTPNWLQSFVISGIFGGLGGIITFVPLIFILYFFMAILEESGYFSRMAFLLEYPLSKIGLSGKSFLPILLGLGCNVPSIYASRSLDNPQLRKLTAIVAPMMSCGARLTVFALFISAFFRNEALLILLSLYLFGIVMLIIIAAILSHFKKFDTSQNIYILELPKYRIPLWNIVFRKAAEHSKAFVHKAASIIFGVIILVWVLTYFPDKGNVQTSYLGKMGQTIQPVFEPLGFGNRWETVASIIPSLVAKEVVVGFLGQTLEIETEEEDAPVSFMEDLKVLGNETLSAIKDSLLGLLVINPLNVVAPPSDEELEEEGGSGIILKLQSLWGDNPDGKLRAYSYMIFILLIIPCVAVLGAYKHEFGWKMVGFVLILYSIIPYVMSLLVYQIGSLFI